MARLPDIPSNLGSSGMDYLTAPLPVQGPDAPHTPDSQPRPDFEPTPIDMPSYHDMPEQDLRKVFAENPDYDKGIGSVLEAIQADQAARPSDVVNKYESEIVQLARVEAVRAHERTILAGVELDSDDVVLGRVHDLYDKFYDGSVDTTLTDQARTKNAVAKEQVAEFLDRHADDDEPESPQQYAVELYTIAKKHYGALGTPQSGTHARAYSDARYKIQTVTTKLNKDYDLAAPIIKDALAQLDAATAQQPPQNSDRAQEIQAKKTKLQEIEATLGTSYAKREEHMLGIGPQDTELKVEYQEHLRELFKLENEEFLRDPAKTPAERLEAINKFMFDRGRDLEGKMPGAEKVQGKLKKTAIKIGSWMSRRHWLTQAAVGVGASMAVGFATGGMLAGATAAGLAYARAEAAQQKAKENRVKLFVDDQAQREANLEALKKSDHSNVLNDHRFNDEDLDELFDHAFTLNDSKFENQIFNEQRRRLGSVGLAAGAGALGWGMAHFTVNPEHIGFGGNNAAEAYYDVDPAPGEGNGAGAPESGSEGNSGDSGTGGDTPPPTSENPPHTSWFGDLTLENYDGSGLENHDYAPGTFTAHYGEGYFDIMERMGIPADQRLGILNSVNDQLSQYSYYEPGDPLPRIPHSGLLPQGAIDILIKAAAK